MQLLYPNRLKEAQKKKKKLIMHRYCCITTEQLSIHGPGAKKKKTDKKTELYKVIIIKKVWPRQSIP